MRQEEKNIRNPMIERGGSGDKHRANIEERNATTRKVNSKQILRNIIFK